MSLFLELVNAAKAILGTRYDSAAGPLGSQPAANYRALYNLFRALYYNDAAEVDSVLRGDDAGIDPVRGLRNPSHAIIEYYVATEWPEGLAESFPLEFPPEYSNAQIDALTRNIELIWRNSNWATKKNLFIRKQTMLGDGIIKVVTRQPNPDAKPTGVHFQIIDPADVTDFDVDERDFFTFIRLDITKQRRNGSEIEQYIHTEVWDKATGRFRMWDHTMGFAADLGALGQPVVDEDFGSMGIDFIPFVQAKFKDDGYDRGLSVLAPGIRKIYEADRMATRLDDLMFRFNKPTKVIHSSHLDARGNPMRPPDLPAEDDKDGKLQRKVGDERVVSLPSGWSMDSLIDDLAYAEFLQAIQEHIEGMRQTDYPELNYYRMDTSSDLSGKALRLMMTAAIARTIEARSHADAALIRANQMALTIAKAHGLQVPGTTIGAFDDGDFEHTFGDRPVVPLSEEEEANIAETKSRTAINRQSYGWSDQALLEEDGLEAADAEDMLREQPAEQLAGDVLTEPPSAQATELLNSALARGL